MPRNQSPKTAESLRHRLAVEELEGRTLLSIAVGAMGDSITAPYHGTPQGRNGDLNWVEQFQLLRSAQITVSNEAVGGATSTSLLRTGQDTRVANLVAAGSVDSALLLIGANDVTQFLSSIVAGDPTPFVNTVVPNITQAVTTVTGAGSVALVVANIPDVTVTPTVRALLNNDPVLLQRVSDAIARANQGIEDMAAARHLPVLDLFNLSHLALHPVAIGGVEVTQFFAPDNYHPGTVSQGIIANTILDGLKVGYHTDVTGLPMSDQEILTTAGINHPPGETYFDVRPYVIANHGVRPLPFAKGQLGTALEVVNPPRSPSSWQAAPAIDRLIGLDQMPARPTAGEVSVGEAKELALSFSASAQSPLVVSPHLLDAVGSTAIDAAFMASALPG